MASSPPPQSRLPSAVLATLATLALGLALFAHAAPQQLGTDAEGDDAAALTAASNPTGLVVGGQMVPCPTADDCSNIDDILALEVSTGTDEVLFKMAVKETPADSELVQGTYCWVAAFQVDGNEEEYLGMGCIAYTNGEGEAATEDSGRGTEVGTLEWASGEAAVLIHVPFDSIGASLGTKLVDIYGLTYLSEYLFVDDALPDAKSDRNAEESLGSFVIGSDTGAVVVSTSNSTSTSGTGSGSGSATGSKTGSGSGSATGSKSGSASGTASGSASDDASAGNGTDDGKGKDAPGMALPVAAASLAVAVALVRRRLP